MIYIDFNPTQTNWAIEMGMHHDSELDAHLDRIHGADYDNEDLEKQQYDIKEERGTRQVDEEQQGDNE